jgi:hypothetical protein
MPLQMLTLDRMCCFAIGFPYWVQQNILKPILHLLRFSHIGYNRIPSDPFCTLQPYRYSHTSPAHPIRQLTRSFLISYQVVPYQTRCGTCCPGGSTPNIQSLADSSTTSHDGINHLHHSILCSNHSIDPHIIKSHHDRWKTKHTNKETSQTQHHKRWKTCTTTNDDRAKQFYNHKPKPLGIQGIGN